MATTTTTVGGRKIGRWAQIVSGYRLSLVGGAVACLVTFALNLSVTIWAGTLPDFDQDGGGRRVLYEGSCSKSKNINTGLHILINILSSVLLGASNYGIQCLSAPSRSQLDEAHAKDRYLDIGVVSVRNLSHQKRGSRALWLTLILSSIPLHLLYNSVVFSSITVPQDYYVIEADERLDFSDKVIHDAFPENYYETPRMEARIHKLMDSYRAGELERLTAADCIDEYAISFVTSRDDVILVHELEGGKDDDSNKNSDRNITFHQTAYTQTFIQFSEPFQWICNLTVSDMIYPKPCRPKLDAIREAADNWQPNHHRIEYCLSKPMPQLCRVNFNIFLAVGVILCNLIKMLVLGYIALYLSPDRLLVLGDAIQSFIAHPDLRSRESSLASRKIVRDTASQAAGKPWTGVRTLQTITKRRLTPVGTTQWTVGVLLYSVSLITSLVLLIAGIRNLQIPRTFGNIWSLGFGEASEAALISWPGSQRPNIVPNAMLANLPHLTFSLIYFQWNAIITTMAIGREWNDFSLQRSGLRVSDTPQGEQRSRYFLQLPFKFSIPLIGTSIMLHWVLSQCIFIVSIETINRIEETGEISWGLITCGYSPVAIMTVLVISIIIPTSVYLIGRRRLPGPMPVAGSCSLAIAAACHHPDGRGHPDAALDRLKWGVMIDWKTQQGAEEPEQGQESQGLLTPASQYDHCGFSKDYIDEPIEGNQYA